MGEKQNASKIILGVSTVYLLEPMTGWYTAGHR